MLPPGKAKGKRQKEKGRTALAFFLLPFSFCLQRCCPCLHSRRGGEGHGFAFAPLTTGAAAPARAPDRPPRSYPDESQLLPLQTARPRRSAARSASAPAVALRRSAPASRRPPPSCGNGRAPPAIRHRDRSIRRRASRRPRRD